MPTPFIISNPPVKRTENDDVLFENMVDRYIGRLVYFSDGNFVKANFPYARMLFVRVQGGGAAGQGIGTEQGARSGGGGGGYAESWIETTSLPESVPVTVGDGGVGAVDLVGNNGTPSIAFGITANGGIASAFRGVGGEATGGQINIRGGFGAFGFVFGGGFGEQVGGSGGDSALASTVTTRQCAANDSRFGEAGELYGGGGSGAVTRGTASAGAPGGDGGDGIVIVELYA